MLHVVIIISPEWAFFYVIAKMFHSNILFCVKEFFLFSHKICIIFELTKTKKEKEKTGDEDE